MIDLTHSHTHTYDRPPEYNLSHSTCVSWCCTTYKKIIFCRAVEGQYSTILVIIVMRLIVLMWNRMCHRFVIPDQEWVQAVINQSHPPTYPWKRWWLWWISARQTNFYELINFVSNIWQHDKLSILWQTIQQWCLDLGNRILGALIGECNKTFWVLWKESQKKHPFFWVPKFGGVRLPKQFLTYVEDWKSCPNWPAGGVGGRGLESGGPLPK